MVTVTRPRQVVVHKIAETFDIELIAKDFMDIDEDGCNFIPHKWDFGLNEWLEGALKTEYFYAVYFSIELYELEESLVGLF